MTRFIVIEHGSDRVYGDTAQLGAEGDVGSPVDAMHLLDRKSGHAARSFGHVGPQSLSASYSVYEVPQSHPVGVMTSEEARDLVAKHGTFVAALIAYNS